MKVLQTILQSLRVFAADVAQGFFLITHSGLALLGLGVFCLAIIFSNKPDLRSNAEVHLIDWLQTRHGLDFSFSSNSSCSRRLPLRCLCRFPLPSSLILIRLVSYPLLPRLVSYPLLP